MVYALIFLVHIYIYKSFFIVYEYRVFTNIKPTPKIIDSYVTRIADGSVTLNF